MTTLRFLHSSVQLLIGTSLLGASSALAPAQEASAPAGDEAKAPCACTCDACRAKHGAQQVAKVLEPEAAAEPTEVDVESEIARVLDTDLGEVERLLGEDAREEGVIEIEVSEDLEVEEEPIIEEFEVSDGRRSTITFAAEERGYLGVTLDPSGDGEGALIMAVVPGSPADKAGLRNADLIVAAEEFPVESVEELIGVMGQLKVGDTATIEYVRDGGDANVLMVNLGERSVLDGATAPPVAREAILPDLPTEPSEGEERVVLRWEPGTQPLAIIVDDPDTELEDLMDEDGGIDVVLPNEAPELRVTLPDVTNEPTIARQRASEPTFGRQQGASSGRFVVEGSGSDALPEGYVEIQTRRERRPAANAALIQRIQRLEAQVAEMTEIVQGLRQELDRRNPR